MEKVKLNKALFDSMIEQEKSELWVPTLSLGIIVLNLN